MTHNESQVVKIELTPDELKKIITEAMQAEMKDFYIDRETHYKQHEFIGNWIDGINNCKKAAWWSFVVFVISGLAGLIIMGIKSSFSLPIPPK